MGRLNKESMDFLIVGWWHNEFYEDAFSKVLISMGYQVKKLSPTFIFKYLSNRLERLVPFPFVATILFNLYFLIIVLFCRPKYILLWRVTHLMPFVIRIVILSRSTIITYNNDDPFSPFFKKELYSLQNFHWRWYRKIITLAHHNFFYRTVNVKEAEQIGVSNARVLMPYFLPWRDKPIRGENHYLHNVSDVVFVGHYEDDQRLEYIKYLVDAGIKITIYGPKDWLKPLKKEGLTKIYQKEVFGNEYVNIINKAKICLCFLSKLNRDQYTRRCFEIPACGSLLLSERTSFLVNLFGESEGAYFFSTKKELLNHVKKLLHNKNLIEKCSRLGNNIVWKQGFSVDKVVEKFIDYIK